MKDNKDQRQNDKKVLPIDRYRHHFDEDGYDASEKSVHQLLLHMRKMREEVPVNYQLQDELRKKLLEKQRQAIDGKSITQLNTNNNKRLPSKLQWICLSLILLLSAIFLIFNKTADYSLQPVGIPKDIVSLWNADSNLSFAVVPNEGVLIARHGQLLLSDTSLGQYRVLDVDTDWLYHSPAISPNGEQVALVRQRQGVNSQLVTIPMQELKNSNQVQDSKDFIVLRIANDQERYTDLSWAPDGSKLAYTVINNQNSGEVWVQEGQKSRLITKGTHPTWSPDGTHLVVQRQVNEDVGALALIDLQAGTEVLLGEGEQPVWGSNGYLTFVSTSQHERVLTFMPDGTPQFTVLQRVGEIRSVFAGDDGQRLQRELAKDSNWLALSTLLVSPDKGVSNREMDWLRQMELEAVREPRVLILDEVTKCHNPVFDAEGETLFYARQDQGYTAILKIDVEERPIDRGVK
jgi:TolB protein